MNIPSTPIPVDFPPIGISRVIEGIDSSLNCEVSFFNLDYYRPAFEEIKDKIQSFSPQIIGFSAILTPTYAYLKKLSKFIKEHFPNIIQVMGGEMSVISNIILLKTGISFCVIGESEPTFSNLIRKLQQDNFQPLNIEDYVNIKGLAFLRNNLPYFTGYEKENTQNAFRQFNYTLMSKFTNLDNYVHKVADRYAGMRAQSVNEFLNLLYPDNRNKNQGAVVASKGCVNKCTFCYRFFKGYKVINPDEVINYIENLKKDCNVGMILFSEENFGTDKKSTSRLLEYLKNSGLNWAGCAVRVKTVNEQTIRDWKEAGCVHINFGIESFSQKMLNVMQKNATVEENLNAIKLCNKYNILTIPGVVIGMPGETEETIQETIDNWSTVVPDDINMPFEKYINFVQAVPGTPLYEYARRIGLLPQSLEDEEKYIESLWEVNADEIKQYLNFTDYQKEEVAYWEYYIYFELIVAYIKKHGYVKVLKHKKAKDFRFKAGFIYMLFPKKVRKVLLKYLMVVKFFGVSRLPYIFVKKVFVKKNKFFATIDISLRKVNQEIPAPVREDEVSTAIIREGR